MNTATRPTTNVPLTTSYLPEPPPLRVDFREVERPVGWVDGTTIGFRGFGNEDDAMSAAWIAHRTLARRFAIRSGRRPIPIDTEPTTLDGDGVTILAARQAIARLLRPGADSPSGRDSYGFTLQIPPSESGQDVHALAYLVYRTMRRSGMRWTVKPPARGAIVDVEPSSLGVPAVAAPVRGYR